MYNENQIVYLSNKVDIIKFINKFHSHHIQLMKYRKLTLQSDHRVVQSRCKTYPSVKLCGKWLQDCGFSPQDKVRITVDHQVLIIELIKE